jgi:hypothetical protein
VTAIVALSCFATAFASSAFSGSSLLSICCVLHNTD